MDNRIKKNKECKKCHDKRWYILDFHHIGEKLACVSILVANAVSKKVILEEISKCEVLCANCHREEHYMTTLVKEGALLV